MNKTTDLDMSPVARHTARVLVGAAALSAVIALSSVAAGPAAGATPSSTSARTATAGTLASATAARRARRPPHSLRVTRRTGRTISLRWVRPRGTTGPVTIYLNRKVVARTTRDSFTFTKLACDKRQILGVQTRGSRIAGAIVRTRTCGGSGGSSGGSGAGGPGSFPGGSGGNGLPARIAQSTGTVFYVSTSGSDASAGSSSAPWRTVGKAIRSLSAGQIAEVAGGTYRESLSLNRGGTASAPITIRNAPGQSPVIQSSGEEALEMGSGAQYVRFQGLVFEGATGSSTTNIYAQSNAHHIEFIGCEIRGSQRQGFFSEPSTSAIQIIACNIHDNGGSGPSGLDHNVYIQGSNHVITSSLVRNAKNGYGIQIYPSSSGIVVSANTVVDNGRGGIIVGSQGGQTTNGARIVGNILAYNGGAGFSTYWGGGAGSDNMERSNLGFGNSGGDLTGSSISHVSPVSGNPLFVNRAGGDFRLSPSSPGLGKGEAAFTPATDLAGKARPAGTGPDLGAYES